MNLVLRPKAEKSFSRLRPSLKKQIEKQFQFLRNNLRHPSLHAKKYDETRDIWQARVNDDWRFYFQICGDCFVILAIVRHPK